MAAQRRRKIWQESAPEEDKLKGVNGVQWLVFECDEDLRFQLVLEINFRKLLPGDWWSQRWLIGVLVPD